MTEHAKLTPGCTSACIKSLVVTLWHGSCSGLHFTAAIGNVECTRMLCEAGADIDLGDKQGKIADTDSFLLSFVVT